MGAREITRSCLSCNGTGKKVDSNSSILEACASCGGTGKIVSLYLDTAFVSGFQTVMAKLAEIEAKIDALGG